MEETISLKEIFEVIKKRLKLIIVLIVGAAVLSTIISYFIITPTYEASSQFIVNQNTNNKEESVEINEIRSNVELINTYNVVIKSPAILEQVADELHLNLTASQLGEKIQVSSEQNSQVVNVTASDIDPETAASIANKTVNVFQDQIPDLMNVDNVKILSEADITANPSPVSPKPMLNIAIAIVLGGMVGVGLAFLLEYMDNTVKTESDVEKKLEMPVLGAISHISEDDMVAHQFGNAANPRGRGELNGQTKKTV